jgi:hypothetical protein
VRWRKLASWVIIVGVAVVAVAVGYPLLFVLMMTALVLVAKWSHAPPSIGQRLHLHAPPSSDGASGGEPSLRSILAIGIALLVGMDLIFLGLVWWVWGIPAAAAFVVVSAIGDVLQVRRWRRDAGAASEASVA